MSEQPIPVSTNWLKDITTSEVDKRHIFDTAYKCREEILTKYFGEPLPSEFVLKIKKQLEEKSDILKPRTGYTGLHELILAGQDSLPNEFFTVTPTIYQEDGMPSQSEVKISRSFVREAREIDPSDSEYTTVHEYPYIVTEGIGYIWLGETGTDELPRVNIDNSPSYSSTEKQKAKPINMRLLDDMDTEYVGLCASQGITSDDLDSIETMEFPDPDNPGKMLGGFMLSMEFKSSNRTLRNNYDDIYALTIIENALNENKSVSSHNDYIDYKLAIFENARRSHLDFSQPCKKSSLTESEILKTVVFALVDIDRIYPDRIDKVSSLGYDHLRSENLEGITQQEKNILKSLSQIILPHCYGMNYGSESKIKTQPKYRIDFDFLRDGKIFKKINSLIFFRGRKLPIFS